MSNISTQVNNNIVNAEIKTKKAGYAFLYAALKTSGMLVKNKKYAYISLSHNNYLVLLKINNIAKHLFNEGIDIRYKTSKNKTREYTGVFPRNLTYDILRKTQFADYENNLIKYNLDGYKFTEQDEKQAFLAAIFLLSGSLYIPDDVELDTKSNGYHLEIKCSEDLLINQIQELVKEIGVEFKELKRTDSYSLYIKNSQMISDFLIYIGADDIALDLNEVVVKNSIKNKVNRQNNCTMANIDKQISASEKQMNAIRIIEKKIGLNSLDEKLQVVAKARLKNPDLSLSALVGAFDDNITKSGLAHRFKNLIKIAEELDGK